MGSGAEATRAGFFAALRALRWVLGSVAAVEALRVVGMLFVGSFKFFRTTGPTGSPRIRSPIIPSKRRQRDNCPLDCNIIAALLFDSRSRPWTGAVSLPRVSPKRSQIHCVICPIWTSMDSFQRTFMRPGPLLTPAIAVPLSAGMQTPDQAPKKFRRVLFRSVIVGILLGVVLGIVAPSAADKMEPLGVGFIKLIRMMICPIIFLTVVVGIASIGNMRKLGRVGWKALVYFEIVSSLALLIGLLVVNVVQPGAGMNVDASKLDAKAIQSYAVQGKHLSSVDFAMNIIPKTFIGAFSEGEILQVLLLAILVGLALAALGQGETLIVGCDKIAHLMFAVVGLIMQAAPLGAFGAMAFTVGHYGLRAFIPLAKLLACVYITSFAFVFIVLGTIAFTHGFSIWRFIKYIKEELLIVLGTSSSESVLPRIMLKMEALGCSKSVVGRSEERRVGKEC